MDQINAIEVLQQLRPLGLRSMLGKTLLTRVNVARTNPHSPHEWDTLLAEMKGQGLIDTRLDVFKQVSVFITDAGLNVLQSAGV